jgi:hypothetical protein
MLPAPPPRRGEISHVAGNLLSSLSGQVSQWGFSPAKKIALIVADGLGAHNLTDHAGHARHLVRRFREDGFTLSSGVPSTTSSALASLTTGTPSGVHGMLGYSIFDPHSRRLLNHLKPFPDGVTPEEWQPQPTIFENLATRSIPSLAVGEARFEGTDFTRAVLRGAPFAGSSRLSDHLKIVRSFFDDNETGLCYLYWPALDRVGHQAGAGSASWVDELEAFDQWLSELAELLGPDEAALVTADHGMVNVTANDRVVLEAENPLRGDVAFFGGEPRLVHLYAQEGVDSEEFVRGVAEWVGERGEVISRQEAVSREVFGPVVAAHLPRIGHAVIFARESWVFYDEATASAASYQMVGQHGSGSDRETAVPCVPLGAFLGKAAR